MKFSQQIGTKVLVNQTVKVSNYDDYDLLEEEFDSETFLVMS